MADGLFTPVSDRSLKQDYPELKEVEEFMGLSKNELLFVWYFSNTTSPFAKIKNPRTRGENALKKVWGKRIPQDLKNEILTGQYGSKFRDAIEKMASYQVEIRSRAKTITENIFNRYEKILAVDDKDVEGDDNKKAYVDISSKIIKDLPSLVSQIESGYGVRDVSGMSSGNDDNNIMDEIRGQ
jgi:hypothetical protein